MPHFRRQVQVNHPFTVHSVQAGLGATFKTIGIYGCDSFRHATDSANRLQREFDEDSDPVRTYVYKENDPAPVAAGLGQRHS